MSLEAPWRYGLRVLVVVLCVAACADLRPTPGRGEVLPVAVVDVSRSMGRMPQAMPEGVRVRAEWVVFADGVETLVGGAEAPTIGRSRSQWASALRYVAATWPGTDVVVLSDGRGTDGDGLAAARAVRAAGGRVFTRAPETVVAEVGLDEARLVAGWPAPRVRVVVRSSTTGEATVRLVQGRRVVDSATLTLEPDARHDLELGDTAPPAEGGTYHVVLEPTRGTPDEDPGDDRLTVGLRPARRVVLFWGVPEAAGFEAGGNLVVRSQREAAPEALEGADLVVMGNVPWRDLGTDGARALERFVSGGGRLLMLGGPEAYAGGGYAGTRLESRLSPLRVPRKEGTELAIVLALDISGSTRGARLAHLVDAARRAIQGLVPGERMGILPFRGSPAAALLEPGAVGIDGDPERAALLAAIDQLESGGETNLPAALRMAGRLVETLPARARRVIVLTDGDPDAPPSAEALASEGRWLRERDIGFGAFVVGDDEAVARLAKYVARSPDDVVAVDRAEALPGHLLHTLGQRRHAKGLVDVPVGSELRFAAPYDTVLAPPPSLGTPSRLHVLEVATDEGATPLAVVLRAGANGGTHPLAAVRQVGAGRVAALAWGPALEGERARRVASLEALRPWIEGMAAASDRGLQADVERHLLRVRWPASSGAGRLLAAGARGVTSLVEVAPGQFEGPLPADAEAGVRVRTASEGSAVRPLHLPARPPAEHRGAGVDLAALDALAAAGGGKRLRPGDRSPMGRPPQGVPLAPWLLLLAGILLVLDRLGAKPDASASDSRGGATVGP